MMEEIVAEQPDHVYAGLGYAVFLPNFRGTDGYGRSDGRAALRQHFGGVTVAVEERFDEAGLGAADGEDGVGQAVVGGDQALRGFLGGERQRHEGEDARQDDDSRSHLRFSFRDGRRGEPMPTAACRRKAPVDSVRSP